MKTYGLQIIGLCVVVGGALALVLAFAPSSPGVSGHAVAASLVEGVYNIQSTRYQNITEANFSSEAIDLDGDGISRLETREYEIWVDEPLKGMKTIVVTIAWPDLRYDGDFSQGAPARQQVQTVLFVNKAQFS